MLISLRRFDGQPTLINSDEIIEVVPVKSYGPMREFAGPFCRVILKSGSDYVCMGTVEDFAKSIQTQSAQSAQQQDEQPKKEGLTCEKLVFEPTIELFEKIVRTLMPHMNGWDQRIQAASLARNILGFINDAISEQAAKQSPSAKPSSLDTHREHSPFAPSRRWPSRNR